MNGWEFALRVGLPVALAVYGAVGWCVAARERRTSKAWQEAALRVAHRAADVMVAADAVIAGRAAEQTAPVPPTPPAPFEIIHGTRGRKVVCEADGTKRGYLLVARGDSLEWVDAWVRLPYRLTTLFTGEA